MSAAGEKFSVSGRYYAVSQCLHSHNPFKKNLACGGLFSLMGTPFGQILLMGTVLAIRPPPPGGASKELSEGDSGTRKPMFHIFAFPEALWGNVFYNGRYHGDSNGMEN